MSELAMKLYFNNRPPEKTGTYKVQSNDVDASAESLDWAGGLSTDVPKGDCWLYCEALAQDIYVRFGSASTTATTNKNGRLLKADTYGMAFYVNPVTHRYIDHIAAASGGTLKVQVVSPIGARNTF